MGGGKGGGGSSAPDPDPRIGKAALENAELGRQWLEFAKGESIDAKQRQKVLDDLTTRIGEQQLAQGDQALEWAGEDRKTALQDRDRYRDWAQEDRASSQQDREWALGERERLAEQARTDRDYALEQREKFAGVEDRMLDDAQNWDSDERLAEEAARARGDVMSSSAAMRGQQQRQMASMGIDPRSGRYQGIDRRAAQDTALQAAGAQNQARNQRRTQALDLRRSAAQYGLGSSAQANQMAAQANAGATGAAGFAAGQYNAGLGSAGLGASAGQAASNYGNQGVGTSINAGNSVLAGQTSANQAAGQASNIMGQGFQGAMQGNSSLMNGLNTQYGNQLQAWSTNRQAAAQDSASMWGGLGSAAGTAAGFMMMSSKDAKTDKRPVDGSALEAVKGLPVERWRYKEGVADGGEREHIGPYAEDMQERAGVGDGQQIPLQDMMGLQLKAIQELGIKVDRLEGRGGKGRSPKAIGNRRPDDLETEYREKTPAREVA